MDYNKETRAFLQRVLNHCKERRLQVCQSLDINSNDYYLYEVLKAYDTIERTIERLLYTLYNVDIENIKKIFSERGSSYAAKTFTSYRHYVYNLEISTFFRYWSEHDE